MKIWLLFVGSLFLSKVSAQSVDSVAMRQVDSLLGIARGLTNKNELDKALEVNAVARDMALDKFGRESGSYGNCCANRGRILYLKGNFPEAEKCWLEVKDIRESLLGKDHPDYASNLSNLVALYIVLGQFKKAEPLAIEVKIIREKLLGREHPDYAASLNHLAGLYGYMGQYEKAEPLFLEAVLIWGRVQGKEHPKYAMSLTGLGNLYFEMGQYEKAESCHLEAKSIKEKVLGKEDPDYAATLINLAILYDIMRQSRNAEKYLLEARSIREKLFGKESQEYSNDVELLAIIYKHMGQTEKVESLYLEAKSIRESLLGKEHPNYTAVLYNLAIFYMDMGQFNKAEPLYLEAIAIDEKVLGKHHPHYANDLGNLANLYKRMGQYEKADKLAKEARDILGKAVGKEHPDYALSMNCLGGLYWEMGQYEKSEPFFLEESSINKLLVERAVHHLSEKELNSYLSKFAKSQDMILSIAHISGSDNSIRACYDNSLFYKGFLLGTVDHVKRMALSDSATKDSYLQLKTYGKSLSAEYSKPLNVRNAALIEELEEKSNILEKDLSRRLTGYSDARRQVNWMLVQKSVKPGEAAIEFVHYHIRQRGQIDSTLYAALVLKHGAPQPVYITLFEEKQLDSLLQTSGEKKADYVNKLYTQADRGAAIVEAAQRSLYELIWQPLERELDGVQMIYFSPSGMLHRLNLGAIPISEEQTVADRYRLVELGSTRQLVIPTKVNPGQNDALLFGGIQYEVDSTFLAQIKPAETTGDLASRGGLSFAYSDSILRGGNWNYLRWTDKEVTSLEPILNSNRFQTTLRKGFAATEEEFKTIGQGKPSPRVLHLATHGYFFSDPKQEVSLRGGLGESEPVFKMSEHPMIRSGLILAGGSHAWKEGKPALEGMEDGILTAYEISHMNLSNTELVVLSACETGLGDIQGNEGVYGLQRAFKIAGAKYLIMSLWQVPDQETSVFMTTFYKNWLDHKMSIPDAFRKTQQEMRERFINPYQWAGFVLLE